MAKDFISDSEFADLSQQGKVENHSPDFISDEDMHAHEANAQSGGFLDSVLGGLKTVGKTIDSYTGAPVRSAIGAAQDGKPIIDAYTHQFGEDPEQAPTGKQIAEKAGVSSSEIPYQLLPLPLQAAHLAGFKPSYSGAAGLGIDLAADPTNLLMGAGPALKVAGAGVKALEGTKLAEMASKALDAGSEFASKGAGKLGQALTGIPAKDVETYIKNTPEINQMIESSGGNMSDAADQTRQGFQDAIQGKRRALNSQVGKALQGASPDKNIDVNPVLDMMSSIKSRINPKLNPESISEIDDLVGKVSSLADDGKVNINDLQEVKNFLMDRAKGSYNKGGQIFQSGTDAQMAAKMGARQSKQILDSVGPEALRDANTEFSSLHRAEKNINKNLITPEKSDSALFAAGSGSNPRNEEYLNKLGDLTGQDFLGQAEKLSAARSFNNPSFLPIDATGKASTRIGLGTVGGYAVGGKIGAIIGGSLTSPMALKAAINAGRIPVSLIQKISGSAELTDQAITKAYQSLKLLQGAPKALDAASSLKSPFLKGASNGNTDRNPSSQSYVPEDEAKRSFIQGN